MQHKAHVVPSFFTSFIPLGTTQKQLLHRHTFRNISWLINIVSQKNGQMVCQELQCHYVHQSSSLTWIWQRNKVIKGIHDTLPDAKNCCTSTLHLYTSLDGVCPSLIITNCNNNRTTFFHQGNGIVFQVTSCNTMSMLVTALNKFNHSFLNHFKILGLS